MKKILAFQSLMLAALFACSMLFVVSCGDDDIEGCTDPEAENFNPDATIESNACVYPRDKFLGNYVGVFDCPSQQLEFISTDSLVFTISEALDADDKSGVILELTLGGFPVPISLEGSVAGDILSISSTLEDVTIPNIPVLGTIMADVEGEGSATIDDASGTLAGNVMVTVTSPALVFLGGSLTDDCTITGMKQ